MILSNDIRWKQRFQNFENAFLTLARMIDRIHQNPQDEAVKMALVQSFEFSFELAWNVLKDYLENEGFKEVSSPKQVIRTAFHAQIIAQVSDWMEAIQKRNLASHTYNQEILSETVNYITSFFFPLAQKFYQDFKSRL